MLRDAQTRWWKAAAALVLLFAFALLLTPQPHGHSSFSLLALSPVLLLFGFAIMQSLEPIRRDERILVAPAGRHLPALSHLPPPHTLA